MKVREMNIYNSLIIDTIREMIRLAKKGNFTAKQELNGVTVLVNGDSNADLIFRDQRRAQSGYIESKVGPYPKTKLTAKDKENDAREARRGETRERTGHRAR